MPPVFFFSLLPFLPHRCSFLLFFLLLLIIHFVPIPSSFSYNGELSFVAEDGGNTIQTDMFSPTNLSNTPTLFFHSLFFLFLLSSSLLALFHLSSFHFYVCHFTYNCTDIFKILKYTRKIIERKIDQLFEYSYLNGKIDSCGVIKLAITIFDLRFLSIIVPKSFCKL